MSIFKFPFKQRAKRFIETSVSKKGVDGEPEVHFDPFFYRDLKLSAYLDTYSKYRVIITRTLDEEKLTLTGNRIHDNRTSENVGFSYIDVEKYLYNFSQNQKDKIDRCDADIEVSCILPYDDTDPISVPNECLEYFSHIEQFV